jgi:hypothetical protein
MIGNHNSRLWISNKLFSRLLKICAQLFASPTVVNNFSGSESMNL